MPRLSRDIAIAAALPLLIAAVASAEEKRSLGAHVHGQSELNIAIEGNAVAMELFSPGADIVGFEHAAKSEADKAAVAAAKDTLSKPLELFVFSAAAGCAVQTTSVELALDGEHGHDHEVHGREGHAHGDHHDHAHDDHAGHDHAHNDHAHEGHGHEGHSHGDHGHEDHGHGDHAHDDHAHSASHSEFHAEYSFICADVGQLAAIDFAFFSAFPNAEKVAVTVVSARGQTGFEVDAAAPSVDLAGKI